MPEIIDSAGIRQPAPPAPVTAPDAPGSVLRRSIVLELRRAGARSPDELARAIGASRSGIVGQLRALEAAGLVTHQTERHGVGRPRHLYDVTPDAQALFPANDDGLAVGRVDAILAVGGQDLLEAVFAARRRQLGIRTGELLGELVPAGSLEARTRALARLQDEQGYLAEVVVGADGALRIVERNCAIHQVAAVASAACDAELELFREVLGTDVARETHMPAGDRCCTYRVEAPPS
jgi:predicted ArsR family transcriptional regulator